MDEMVAERMLAGIILRTKFRWAVRSLSCSSRRGNDALSNLLRPLYLFHWNRHFIAARWAKSLFGISDNLRKVTSCFSAPISVYVGIKLLFQKDKQACYQRMLIFCIHARWNFFFRKYKYFRNIANIFYRFFFFTCVTWKIMYWREYMKHENWLKYLTWTICDK